jgi:hypothetical protein
MFLSVSTLTSRPLPVTERLSSFKSRESKRKYKRQRIRRLEFKKQRWRRFRSSKRSREGARRKLRVETPAIQLRL